jgi:drug/metabolite transporter (DMT)-like permease
MKVSLIKLHIAVFLWGFTAVLGRLISLNEGLLVWYRIFITVVTLFIIMKWRKKLHKVSLPFMFRLFGIGGIIALHWAFFYGSIKYANISIALTCLSSAAFFTALLEPLMLKKRIHPIDLLLGVIGIVGIYLIFHFDPRYQTGIIIGVIATILSVIFSILNKKIIHHAPSQAMMLYELTGGLLVLSLLMPFYLYLFPTKQILPTSSDWLWLLLLSWFCTIIAMDLSLQALKKVSAFTQNLTLNLEPVYGIILAFVVFHENKYLSSSFYYGFALIILSVILQMLRVIKYKRL